VSRLLVVDDDVQMQSALEAALRRKGFSVETASNGLEASRKLENLEVSAVLTDLRMPGMNGFELLQHIRENKPALPVIVLSAYGSVPDAVEAMKAGASDFLLKPFSADALDEALSRLSEDTAAAARTMPVSLSNDIITEDPEMRMLLKRAAHVARARATILVQAESGTGKELLARWIHKNSAQSDGPFIAVNCAALPENLLESELFGYEKGAFTGANTMKPGKFELAQNGTILLDEIGEMVPLLQAKLLRVLQEHELDRVGGKRPIRLNVRVIATTNKNLRKLIQRGQFREDLYFRLNVVPLRIPPLRERKGDIPVLVQYFAKKYGATSQSSEIDAEILELLTRYSWPGNVRELENVIQRSFAIRGSLKLSPVDLYDQAIDSAENSAPQAGSSVSEMERKLIMATLEETSGNRTHAAKLLGISLRTLRNKLREYRVVEAAI
jgi:DNA-binding NtrC family response regulator